MKVIILKNYENYKENTTRILEDRIAIRLINKGIAKEIIYAQQEENKDIKKKK